MMPNIHPVDTITAARAGRRSAGVRACAVRCRSRELDAYDPGVGVDLIANWHR
jgi:hypothetical protein